MSIRKATADDADALFGLAKEFATSFVPERTAFEIALADIISTAASEWNSSGASVTFCEGDLCGSKNTDGYAITINVVKTGSGVTNIACGNSVACVRNTGSISYPHIRNQTLTIEEPPYVGNTKKRWINSQFLIGILDYYYLPSTMMHEFGHSAGLGHSPVPIDVMGFPADKRTLSSNDEDAMNANYTGHSSHRR